MLITIVGNFGLGYKGTMAARAVPIARELGRLNYQVDVLLPAESKPAAKLPLSEGYRLVELGTNLASAGNQHGIIAAVAHLWNGLRLTSLAIRRNPDVLYAFKPKGYAGLAVMAFWLLRTLRLSRSTIVLDVDDWEGKGGWADREPGPWWESWFVTWHERWCLAHADLITAASRELVALARRDASDVVYVPNAASSSSPGWTPGDREAGRARLRLGDNPIVLVYTRFLEFSPQRLVDTFQTILADIPDAHLVVVGKGLNGEEEIFSAVTKRQGLDDRVVSLGWTEPVDLPGIFAAADIALYLMDDSLLNRAKCPMKLVDLLLAGVPVVADRVGQAVEYIVDGVTGWLVTPGSVEAMASTAVTLLTDADLRTRLRSAARSDILSRWNWSEQAAGIDEAIRHVRMQLQPAKA